MLQLAAAEETPVFVVRTSPSILVTDPTGITG